MNLNFKAIGKIILGKIIKENKFKSSFGLISNYFATNHFAVVLYSFHMNLTLL